MAGKFDTAFSQQTQQKTIVQRINHEHDVVGFHVFVKLFPLAGSTPGAVAQIFDAMFDLVCELLGCDVVVIPRLHVEHGGETTQAPTKHNPMIFERLVGKALFGIVGILSCDDVPDLMMFVVLEGSCELVETPVGSGGGGHWECRN